MPYIEDPTFHRRADHRIFRLHWVSRELDGPWIVLAIPPLGITLILALYDFLRLRSYRAGRYQQAVIYKKGSSAEIP